VTTVRAWILVGENDSRKSSTIRCLTGLQKPDYHDIALENGQCMPIYAEIRSLQEHGEDKKYTPEGYCEFIKIEIKSYAENGYITPKYYNLILPIHYNSGNKSKSGKEYIYAFVKSGWEIQSVISMGERVFSEANSKRMDWVSWLGCHYGEVPESTELSSTESASRIRKFWGWKG